MLGVWHGETQRKGPHRGDVEMFERYLGGVVCEERDLEKARTLVKWLEWVVEEGAEGEGKKVWREAVGGIRRGVDEAVKGRGLGGINWS